MSVRIKYKIVTLSSKSEIEDYMRLDYLVWGKGSGQFNQDVDKLRREVQADVRRVYGIYQRNVLVAAINFKPYLTDVNPWQEKYRYLGKHQTWISSLMVRPGYRGKGMALALKEELHANYTLILTSTSTRSSDPAMAEINRRMGYTVIDEVTVDGDRVTFWMWRRDSRAISTESVCGWLQW
jgi:GNAT superfamily N-acetyltransferase